ncbi:MAG: hypothetical protein AAB320_03960 [Elusimicrobiota bacterium]
MDDPRILSLLKQTKLLRAPAKALSTFGATVIEYHLISPVPERAARTRLREGVVRSQKPRILTPESFSERFQGFGDGSQEYLDWLKPAYRDLLRALEYNFKNEGLQTQVISESASGVADRILADLDGRNICDQAVIACPDGGWSLALMKFTLDQAAGSFPTHVRDLERRGLFDPAGKETSRRRREIEALFAAAASDRGVLKRLGEKLREHGLFSEYEDRYLRFF